MPKGMVVSIVSIIGKIGESFQELFSNTYDAVTTNLIPTVFKIILVIALYKLALSAVSASTSRIIRKNKAKPEEAQNTRTESLMTLLRSASRYVLIFVCILSILSVCNIEVSSLLSTVGLTMAAAIGIGAQNFVKDVVAGLFMIFENQFSVGDHIKTEDDEGIVTATALRVTYIRSLKGYQIIIPNGSISRVINYTRGGYSVMVDILTPYESDTRSVMEVINAAVQHFANEKKELFIERPEVLGIVSFGESNITIRIACQTKALQQWEVERGLRLAVKEAFDAAGISFPYPHMTVASKSSEVNSSPSSNNKQIANNAPSFEKPIWQVEDLDL